MGLSHDDCLPGDVHVTRRSITRKVCISRAAVKYESVCEEFHTEHTVCKCSSFYFRLEHG